MAIEDKFKEKQKTASDINEHLDTIRHYVSGSDVAVEMGVRGIVSTWAILMGKPKKLISIDLVHPINHGGNIDEVKEIAKAEGIDFEFIQGDSLKIDIPECDVLFIDTNHTYEQVTEELKRHSNKVKKYIILHDTEIPEMKRAVYDFMGEWKVKEMFSNNNGLTILAK